MTREAFVPVKDFSLFQIALQTCASQSTEDLGYVANISRRDFEKRETFTFRCESPCLEYASLLIENALLLRASRAGRIYAGFEKLSRMEPIIDRYLRIADLSERLYVFGEADWKPPRHPNMKSITVAPRTSIAREWFIISDAPSFRIALVASSQDVDAQSAPEARSFHVFKSSNEKIVARLAAAADGLVDSALAA